MIQLHTFEARVTALEVQVPDCMSDIGGHAVFSGCNDEINNGLDTTDSTIGYGNLMVGYNTNTQTYARTGSHNVVIGNDHGYSSYGGIVAGFANQILGAWSTVTGGQDNIANSVYSTGSGGQHNQANGSAASVSGGQNNQATNANASVSGGNTNIANNNSTVSGGQNRTSTSANDWTGGGLNQHS
jgi:hypothetical protein